MRPLLLASVLIWGCGPSLQQIRERELCYGQAEAQAQASVDRECYAAGLSFAQCPAREAIMSQLADDQSRCP